MQIYIHFHFLYVYYLCDWEGYMKIWNLSFNLQIYQFYQTLIEMNILETMLMKNLQVLSW